MKSTPESDGSTPISEMICPQSFEIGSSSFSAPQQLQIYEYIFAFILDQAANIHFELRATGIVSTMPIRDKVKVPWGTTIAPGVLAVNHQHLFNFRIGPAIDGYQNTIIFEDVVPVPGREGDDHLESHSPQKKS